jgi:hypothetical protein
MLFYTESKKTIEALLHTSELISFFNIVKDYNIDVITVDAGIEVYHEPVINNLDLAILTLLTLRAVRFKLLDSNSSFTQEDIDNAIGEMKTIITKIYRRTYLYHDFCQREYDCPRPYEEEEIGIVQRLFRSFLGTLGKTDDDGYFSFTDEYSNEEIQKILLDILNHPILLDHLPMDLLAIIDKEYYTKIHEEQNEKKAMASWFDIIDSLTLEQLDNIVPIKLFIYEALGNKFQQCTSDAIKQKLTDKITQLKNPQNVTHHTTVNKTYKIGKIDQFVDTLQEQTIKQ